MCGITGVVSFHAIGDRLYAGLLADKEAIERALVQRLDDRHGPYPFQNNRRSRRASKANDR